MPEIKAIIFDFGKVIRDFDDSISIKKFKELGADDRINGIYESETVKKYESGQLLSAQREKVTQKEFISIMKKEYNLNISDDEFFDAYTARFHKPSDKDVFDLIIRLRETGYKVALLTNASELDWYAVVEDYIPEFDAVTYSYEVGVKKPEDEIYEDSLEKLRKIDSNIGFENCIFIDDIEAYSDKFTCLGGHGVHFIDYEQLVKELNKLGVKV